MSDTDLGYDLGESTCLSRAVLLAKEEHARKKTLGIGEVRINGQKIDVESVEIVEAGTPLTLEKMERARQAIHAARWTPPASDTPTRETIPGFRY